MGGGGGRRVRGPGRLAAQRADQGVTDDLVEFHEEVERRIFSLRGPSPEGEGSSSQAETDVPA